MQGLYVYVILKFDGSKFTFVASNPGLIDAAVTDNVLIESKTPQEIY